MIFQNSGAEATEQLSLLEIFYSDKPKIELFIKNSFHGRTVAAISASGSKKMTEVWSMHQDLTILGLAIKS